MRCSAAAVKDKITRLRANEWSNTEKKTAIQRQSTISKAAGTTRKQINELKKKREQELKILIENETKETEAQKQQLH